jgi:hypothetical protein
MCLLEIKKFYNACLKDTSFNKNSNVWSLLEQITLELIKESKPQDHKEEYLTAKEFVKKYPFLKIGELYKINRYSESFDGCKKVGNLNLFNPMKVMQFIVKNKKHTFKLSKKLKEFNYFGFEINEKESHGTQL